MNRFTQSMYDYLNDLENRVFFINEVYSSIIRKTRNIHPDILQQWDRRRNLLNFIRNFNKRSVPYCEDLQRDLDYFNRLTKDLEFYLELDSNTVEENHFSPSRLGSIVDDYLGKQTNENITESNFCETIVQETDPMPDHHKYNENIVNNDISLKNLDLLVDVDAFPSPNSNNRDNAYFSSLVSSNEVYASTKINESIIKIQDKNILIEDLKDENLIDFSSVVSSKINKNFESKAIQRIKNEPSITNVSPSNSKSTVLSKSKKIKYVQISQISEDNYYVTHVESPILMFIQVKDNQEKMEAFEKKLNLFYNDEINSNNTKCEFFDLSILYAVKFSIDKKWYRARIMNVDEKKKIAKVFYMDYGNSEHVEFERIRMLEDYFYKETIFAFPASLSMAFPSNESKTWDSETLEFCRNLLLNREVKMKSSTFPNWPIYFCKMTVKLNNKVENVLEYLIDQKLALSVNNLEIVKQFKNEIKEYDKLYHINSYYNFNNSNIQPSSQSSSSSPMINVKKQKTTDSQIIPPQVKNQVDNLVIQPTDKYDFIIEDLPAKNLILDKSGCFLFEITNAISPNEIYINFINDEYAYKEYSSLDEKITNFYQKHKDVLNRFSNKKKYDYVVLNSICIAENPQSGFWYRVQIKDFDSKCKDKPFIKVVYIDYGLHDVLDYANLFPMFKQFANLPPYSILCQLDNIPNNRIWNQIETEYFFSLIKNQKIFKGKINNEPGSKLKINVNKGISVRFVSAIDTNNNEVDFDLNKLMLDFDCNQHYSSIEKELDNLESASCIQQSNNIVDEGRLKINLPIEDNNAKIVKIQKYLEDCQKYKGKHDEIDKLNKNEDKFEANEFEELIEKKLPKETNIDKNEFKQDAELENWDPKASEFFSPKNFYGFNDQNGEAHVFGYETKYENDICEQFNTDGFCTRKNCHRYHKKRTETLVPSTKNKIKAYTECTIGQKTLINKRIFLSNIKYIGCECFEGTIMSGIDWDGGNVPGTNFSNLLTSMNNYYGEKLFLPEKSTIFTIGQIVAARSNLNNIWLRARIVDTINIENVEQALYKVKFIDIKGEETLGLKDLYLINQKFLNTMPAQCFFKLSSIVINASSKLIERTFEKATNKFEIFWANVFNINNDNKLEIQLFGADEFECQVDMNEFLVKQKLAINMVDRI